jgi:hypothetical protein
MKWYLKEHFNMHVLNSKCNFRRWIKKNVMNIIAVHHMYIEPELYEFSFFSNVIFQGLSKLNRRGIHTIRILNICVNFSSVFVTKYQAMCFFFRIFFYLFVFNNMINIYKNNRSTLHYVPKDLLNVSIM